MVATAQTFKTCRERCVFATVILNMESPTGKTRRGSTRAALAVIGVGFLILGGFLYFGLSRRETETPAAVGDYRQSLTVQKRTRTYLLHLPKGYTVEQVYPLVFLFHGGAGSGSKIAGQTGFSDYADREGFVAVYPDGIKHNWNDGRDTTDAYKAGADDIGFVRALVAELTRQYRVDEKRIFAAGVSNGGFFTQRLACEMADVFAAVGTVSASMPTKLAPRCNPSVPVSALVIQGTADPGIPIGGGVITGFGDGGVVESAENTLKLWVLKNACLGAPQKEMLPPTVNDGTRVERTLHESCQNGTAVAYYIIHGMGHGWPPKRPQAPRVAGPTSQNIDATQTIWQFFKTHPKL